MLKTQEPRKEFRVALYRCVLLQWLGTLIATALGAGRPAGSFYGHLKSLILETMDFSPPRPARTRGRRGGHGGQVAATARERSASADVGFNGIDLIQCGVSDWRFADALRPVNKPRNRIIVPLLR